VLYITIVFSLLVAIVFLIAFFWAVRSGQFDDTYSPAVRILFDDKPEQTEKHANHSSHNSMEN
jgi:cbb3-type cytochrome oxidase maturation protein